MEDSILGMASERIFLPMIRKTVPEIVDSIFPPKASSTTLVIVSIDKRYPWPRAQDHERLLGAGTAHVLEDHRRRGQGRRTAQRQRMLRGSSATHMESNA